MDVQTVILFTLAIALSSLVTCVIIDVRRRAKEENSHIVREHQERTARQVKSEVLNRSLDSQERREITRSFKSLTTQQNHANRIVNILSAAARLNPTHLVNPQAKIVVHNLGCLSGGTTHEIFVGWKNQYHTLGIVQVLIDKHNKVWSESPSAEAVFNTSAFPSDNDVDCFARNVADFVVGYNRLSAGNTMKWDDGNIA